MDPTDERLKQERANRQEAVEAINGAIVELTAASASIDVDGVRQSDWDSCIVHVMEARERLGKGSRFYH